MNFQISETSKPSSKTSLIARMNIGFFKILLLIVLLPVFLIKKLIDLLKKDNSENIIKNEWEEFYSCKKFKLNRLFIDEDDLPLNLDYPEEPNDLYLFKIKSDPQVDGLETKYFTYQYQASKSGIYLFSFNKLNEGMTLWYINNLNPELERVKDLKSSWWNISKSEESLLLKTTFGERDIEITINEG